MKVGSLEDILGKMTKAFTTIAGSGGDFLPSPLASEFIDFIRDKNFLRQMFRTVTMISKTRDVPKILDAMDVYYESAENTDAVETDFATGTIQFVAKKFFAYARMSSEEIEDAAFDMDVILRDAFTAACAEHEEKAMVAGDTTHTATSATPAAGTDANWYAKDSRLIYDGLLKLGGDISDAAAPLDCGGASMSATLIRMAMYRLGKYGRVMQNLVLILNPWSANQLLDDSKLVTLDKYGPQATIFTGEIGKLYGKVIVINSSHMDDTYGVITHTSNPVIGDRRLIKIELEREAKKDATDYVLSERHDFKVEHGDAICKLYNLENAEELS